MRSESSVAIIPSRTSSLILNSSKNGDFADYAEIDDNSDSNYALPKAG